MAREKQLDEALRAFANIQSDKREEAVKAIEDAEPAISIDDLAKAVSTRSAIDRELLTDLLTGLAGIVAIVGSRASTRDGFVPLLLNLAIGGEPSETPNAQQLADQLGRLLASEKSLGVTGKAQNVLWGHGRVYRDAHILSQIRPIFYNDLESEADNAVIVHELRLEYREGEEDGAICVAMDQRKLQELTKVLKRAIMKESNLRKSGKFNYLSPLG